MGWDWLYNPIAPIQDIASGAKDLFSGGGNDSGGGGQAPSPQPLPEAPKPEASAEKAQETVKRRRSTQSKTVFGDPLGYGGQADIVRKTLTGQ